MVVEKNYRLGLDSSSISYFVITDKKDNSIVSIMQVPQASDIYKNEIKELTKSINLLKPDLKIKGMKTKTEAKILDLKRQLNRYVDNSPKNTIEVYEWLMSYRDKIEVAVIEKKLLQTANQSTIQSFCKLSEYMGINKALLDLCEIPHNTISITDWRKQFNYGKLSKEEIQRRMKESGRKTIKESDIKREFVKQESIRIAGELIPNISDWWKPNGCKNINDDIAESSLLSIIKLD